MDQFLANISNMSKMLYQLQTHPFECTPQSFKLANYDSASSTNSCAVVVTPAQTSTYVQP